MQDAGEYKPVTLLLVEMVDTSRLQRDFSTGGVYRFGRRYVRFVENLVSEHGGAMCRFFGGSLAAVFGAPLPREDHATGGCKAAWHILKGLPSLFPQRRDNGPMPILQISLVSGQTLILNPLRDGPFVYKDFVGLRNLFALAKMMLRGGKIVVHRNTRELAGQSFSFRPLGVPTASEAVVTDAYELVKPKKSALANTDHRARRLSAFVGRDEELSTLLRAAEEARKGRGRIVALWGEAGIGKSRLTDEFKKRLELHVPYRDLTGHCEAYSSTPPFYPILEVVKTLCGIRPGDNETAAKNKIHRTLQQFNLNDRSLAGPLHEMLAFSTNDDDDCARLSPAEKKRRISSSVRRLLTEASKDRLLVLVIEDIHWIDFGSEELLMSAPEWIRRAAVLVILLFRPEYTGPLRSASGVESIHLDSISPPQVHEMVRSILGQSVIDASVMRLIEEKTGGNPLFVEEITRALVSGGAFKITEDRAVLDLELSPNIVPAGVQTVISARLAWLKQEVRETLVVASVIGVEFTRHLLKTVLAAGNEVDAHLATLQDLEFIYEKGPSSSKTFAFKHALTQDSAYRSLVPTKQKELHEKIAMALEGLYANNVDQVIELLAHHHLSSENWPAARRCLRLAGDKARRQSSFGDAYHFYCDSFLLWKKGPLDDAVKREAIDTALACDWVVLFLDAPRGYGEILQQGENMAMELGDHDRLMGLQASKALYSRMERQSAEIADFTDQCLDRLQTSVLRTGSREELAAILPAAVNDIGMIYTTGRFAEMLPNAGKLIRAIELARCEKEYFGIAVNPYLTIVTLSIVCLGWAGEFAVASSLYQKALPVALELDDANGLGWLEFAQAIQKMEQGDITECEIHLQRAIEKFEEANLSSELFWSSLWAVKGIVFRLRGEFTSALEYLEKSIHMDRKQSTPIFMSKNLYDMGLVYLQLGDLTAAEECCRSAIEWAEKCGEEHCLALALMLSGLIHVRSYPLQMPKGEALIQKGIDITKRLGAKPFIARGYFHLGEFHLMTGRPDEAAKSLRKAERMFRSLGMVYWVNKVREMLNIV